MLRIWLNNMVTHGKVRYRTSCRGLFQPAKQIILIVDNLYSRLTNTETVLLVEDLYSRLNKSDTVLLVEDLYSRLIQNRRGCLSPATKNTSTRRTVSHIVKDLFSRLYKSSTRCTLAYFVMFGIWTNDMFVLPFLLIRITLFYHMCVLAWRLISSFKRPYIVPSNGFKLNINEI